MSKFKALYLEDDRVMHLLISSTLPEDIECYAASTIQEAKKALETENYHLILVDLNLGEESGFDFIEFLKKKEFAFMPSILIVTASENEEDEIKSHEADVFEYIRKPIRPNVLKSQLEKYLRRFRSTMAARKLGPLRIDEQKMEVKMYANSKEESIFLTLKEYKLLLKLINNPRKTYTREELLAEVWNASSDVQSRTIDMHISSLRKKLGTYGDAISSIRGVGYALDPEKFTEMT